MESSLVSELSALRERAEGLIKRADLLKTSGNIEGIGKVKKKIQAELTFIKSVSLSVKLISVIYIHGIWAYLHHRDMASSYIYMTIT